MFEFFDPTTGAFTAAIAIAMRILEAVWKEIRRRSKRNYKLKRAQQASEAETIQTSLDRRANVSFEGDNRRYTIMQIPK